MRTATSADGTAIAFDESGHGPPVVMVVGAFNARSTTAPLAAELASRFTVFNYDRRGRGDSGDSADTPAHAVEREIEDLAAVIAAAGGSACVFGYSSGATLALKAAAAGLPISKLALYEPPFLLDDSRPRPPADLPRQLTELVSAGRRGDAVELYQARAVGMPEEVVARLRSAPFRPGLEAIARTLIYDASIIGDLSLPTAMMSTITTPTLVLDGEDSWPFMRDGVEAAADALPSGRRHTLAGQTHDIDPSATAPVLEEFFAN
jgi:pimeloyl-ACP methyl ester carboxylesterase